LRRFGQQEELDASEANELAYGFATASIVHDDGRGATLVDENRTLSLDAVLILAPLHPAVRDVGMIALAGRHDLFKLSFSSWTKFQTAR
jgi:hypothetical protein